MSAPRLEGNKEWSRSPTWSSLCSLGSCQDEEHTEVRFCPLKPCQFWAMSADIPDKSLKLFAALVLFTSAYLWRTSLCELWMWIFTKPMSGKIESQWGIEPSSSCWKPCWFKQFQWMLIFKQITIVKFKLTMKTEDIVKLFRLNEAVLPTVLTKCILTVCRWTGQVVA